MSVHSLARPASSSTPEFVEANITFAEPIADKPYTYTYRPPEGVAATNIVTETLPVRIENARAIAGTLSLDVEGIAVVRRRSAVRDFWDEAQTLAARPSTRPGPALVKDVTGAQPGSRVRLAYAAPAASMAPFSPTAPAGRQLPAGVLRPRRPDRRSSGPSGCAT